MHTCGFLLRSTYQILDRQFGNRIVDFDEFLRDGFNERVPVFFALAEVRIVHCDLLELAFSGV